MVLAVAAAIPGAIWSGGTGLWLSNSAGGVKLAAGVGDKSIETGLAPAGGACALGGVVGRGGVG